VPDGWLSIPIITRFPTAGSRADGLPPSPLYTAGAALAEEKLRETERKVIGRKTYRQCCSLLVLSVTIKYEEKPSDCLFELILRSLQWKTNRTNFHCNNITLTHVTQYNKISIPSPPVMHYIIRERPQTQARVVRNTDKKYRNSNTNTFSNATHTPV